MIIFVGASGAGKGTQGNLLATAMGYAYFAMGDIIRQYGTPTQRTRLLSGQLVSDGETIAMMSDALSGQTDPNRVILDGFPRTVAQGEWLIANASAGHYEIEAIIHLEVAPDVLLARLQARGREDDTLEAINARLAWYEAYSKPVLELFRNQHCLILDIDGNGTSERVYDDIMNGLANCVESNRA